MGQKVSPIGFRTGITRGWASTWFASKADYGTFLVEDQKIRKFIDNQFNRQMPKGGVAKTEVIRTRNEVTVTLHSARPGVVIGPRGGEVENEEFVLERVDVLAERAADFAALATHRGGLLLEILDGLGDLG